MKIFRCGMPGCNNYIPEDELKQVYHNKMIIAICESCDDGSLKTVDKQGDANDSFKKVEKIRRKKNRYED